MAGYRTTIETPADSRSVFDYLSRFDNAADWDPGVTSGAMTTTGPVRVGSRFRLVARFLGRSMPLDYEVVELDAPRRIVLRADAATFSSTDTIVFAERGGDGPTGTRVTYDAVLEGKGVLRFADVFIGAAFRRIGDRAGGGLRRRLQEPLA